MCSRIVTVDSNQNQHDGFRVLPNKSVDVSGAGVKTTTRSFFIRRHKRNLSGGDFVNVGGVMSK